MVILLALSLAANTLGLPGFSAWVSAGMASLPRLVIGAVILLVGYAGAGWLRDALVQRAPADAGRAVGRIAFGTIIGIAGIAAIGELGIDITLVESLVAIIAAAVFAGIAIAFGIGAAGPAGDIIAGHYLRRSYQPGQRVRFRELTGEILELTQTAVLIELRDGRALIPARLFAAEVSVLLDAGDRNLGE